MVRGHVATISAGAFATQVLIVRRPPEEPIGEPDLPGGSAVWERATVRIWPPRGRWVSLPPQVPLDDQNLTLEDFNLRWPFQSTRRKQSRL